MLALALVVAVGVVAYQAARTALALREASQATTQLREQLGDGDLTQARQTVETVATSARTARTHSDGVLWRSLGVLPVVGDDARAVSDLSLALDELASVAPDGLAAVEQVSEGRLRGEGGGLDLQVLRELQQPLSEVALATGSARAAVADVEPAGLIGPLRPRAADFLDQLESLDRVMSGAEAAVELLPAMLGGEGRRDYLLVVQNNAEVRATGGLPGSASVLTARDGRLDLGFQGSAGDLQAGSPSGAGSFEPGERETFGPLLRTDFRDANFTPDFPRAAARWAQYADGAVGREVDGVVSLDPITLAQVLRATGPVDVAGTELGADNAVRALLFEPYQSLDTEQQDLYFAFAARAILDALLDEQGDQLALVETLAEAVSQRRLQVWSRDDAEQDRLDDLPVAGALPTGTGRPEVGMYLNDATEAKMQYFLRQDADLVSLGCDPEGRPLLRATLDLTTDVTQPVSGLAQSVTGNGRVVPRGDTAMFLRVFAPEGGELRALEVDGDQVEVARTRVYDREVATVRLQLDPQQRSTVTAVVAAAEGDTADPRLQWTPGMSWQPSQATAESRCR